jgi:DNA topoisomerase-1
VKHGTVSASIPRGQDPATVTLAQAVELIAMRAALGGKKAKGTRQRAKAVAEGAAKPKPAKSRKAKKVEA